MAKHIKRVAEEIFGESKGNKQLDNESWQWNEDIQPLIKDEESTAIL